MVTDMEKRYFAISAQDKEIVITRIRDFLGKLPDIGFAYVHGSFFMSDRFRDIDIAVHLGQIPTSALQLELTLETELARIIRNYPIEVRTLNSAPLSFRYNVIKYGKPVFVPNDDARTEFEEATFSRYFDFAPYREIYLKEALGRGI
jgi:hypothetical protein